MNACPRSLAVLACAILACGRASGPPEAAERIGLPPGAASRPPELVARMAAALDAKGRSYAPRTEHLRADGRPLYTNRLIFETSPYLLQHAHNPVDWYPWGDEAFERARRESKPIFLSVGYATCHWCHVMEHESFEDEAIARLLNERYVAVKVDREERPDVDAVYMTAVVALTGGGGWPMSVWLTPDREPFFGGTYFPPEDGGRGVGRGLKSLLVQLGDAYRANPGGVAEASRRLVAHVREAMAPAATAGVLSAATLEHAAQAILATSDPTWGGFGGAPKFPRSVTLEFLLRYGRRTGSKSARDAVEVTLDRMARGGIYDQVGGGFHRYSTDARWLVPHFEKTLYDNALLAIAYVEGWQVTGRPEFARTARQTLDYLLREMRSPEGGFASATDADSEGEEGRFFVWTAEEIDRALAPARSRIARAYFGVTAEGNFAGRNVLWVPETPDHVAAQLGITPDELLREISTARQSLAELRAGRPAPLCDDKVVAGWNGLAISAFARAGLAFGEPRFTDAARGTAEWLTTRMIVSDRLRRSYRQVVARHEASLEDYAFLIAGLLDLHEATQDRRWARQAVALETVVSEHFADPTGGFFSTADDAEAMLVRAKTAEDGATPSGNAVAITNLLRLAELTADDRYRATAKHAFEAFAGLMAEHPVAAPRLLSALDFSLDLAKQIVIVAPGNAGDPAATIEPLLARIRTAFVPNRTLLVAAEGGSLDELANLAPVAEGRRAIGGTPTAYVCEGRVCDLPTSDPDELARQVAKARPLDEGRAPVASN
jgi:hypothetical protein